MMRCMLVFLVFCFGCVLDEFRQRIPSWAARHGEEFNFKGVELRGVHFSLCKTTERPIRAAIMAAQIKAKSKLL